MGRGLSIPLWLARCPRDRQEHEAQHVLSPTDRSTALRQVSVFSESLVFFRHGGSPESQRDCAKQMMRLKR